MRRALVCLLMVAVPVGGAVLPAGTAGAAPPPPAGNACVAAIRATFAPHGAGVVNRFIAISYRESRWTANIQNSITVRDRRGKVYGRATGCLQILPLVARNVGSTCDLRSSACNAQTARRLWLKMGWSPWAVR